MPRLAHVLAHLTEQHQRSVGNSAIAAEYAEALRWLQHINNFDDTQPMHVAGTIGGIYYEFGDAPLRVEIHAEPPMTPVESYAHGVQDTDAGTGHAGDPASHIGDPNDG